MAMGLANSNPAIFVLASLSLTCLVSLLMSNLVEKRFLVGSSHFGGEAGPQTAA